MSAAALLDAERNARPDAVLLATVVSLASLVDPPLLRRARLTLLPPTADAGVEADLWLGPLVESRGPQGLTLLPNVRDLLRAELARDRDRLDRAWEVTRAVHAHLSPALRVEEEIAWLALRDDDEARERIEQLLRSALAAMVGGERRGLAYWASRALDDMPAAVQASESARMIRVGADLRVTGSVRTVADDERLPAWLPAVAPPTMARVPVRVQLLAGAVWLDAAHTSGGPVLHLPETDPLLVELSWAPTPAPNGGGPRSVTLRRGESRTVTVPPEATRAGLTIRTVLGEEYDLRPAGRNGAPALEAEVIDFGETLARHTPFFGRERELAEIEAAVRSSLDHGGWIEVRAEPGIGASALLAEVVRRAPRWGVRVAAHFYTWGEPALVDLRRAERSLAAQAALALGHHKMPNESPLAGVLAAAGTEHVPALFVVDAVGDANAASIAAALDAFPEPLPPGVAVLYSRPSAGRPAVGTRRPTHMIELAPDIDAAARRLDAMHDGRLLEFARPLAEAVGGRVELGEAYVAWRGIGAVDSMGYDLMDVARRGALLDDLWSAVSRLTEPDAPGRDLETETFAMLAAAREPFVLESGYPMHAALPLLTHRPDGRVALRGAATRAMIASRVGPDRLRRGHEIANGRLCLMADPGSPVEQFARAASLTPYGVRHAVEHLIHARHVDVATQLGTSAAFMARKVEEVGLHALEQDLLRVAAAASSHGGRPTGPKKVLLDAFVLDAGEHRRAARDAIEQLGLVDVSTETSGTGGETDVKVALRNADEADVYVLIVGGRDATPIMGDAESFTEVEYEWAMERGIRVLVFLQNDDAVPRPPRKSPKIRSRAEEFRARLRREQVVATFSTPDELRARVARALRALQTPGASEMDALLGGLRIESRRLQRAPRDTASILYTRLLADGWTPDAIRARLGIGADTPPLRIAAPVETSATPTPSLTLRAPAVGCVQVAGRGRPAILSWHTDGSVELRDEDAVAEVLFPHAAEVTGVAYSLPTQTAVSASRDGSLAVLDVVTRLRVRHALHGHDAEVLGVTLAGDRTAVSWSADRTLRLWDIERGAPRTTLTDESAAAPSACAATHRWVVSGHDDGTLRVWDVTTGALHRAYAGHEAAITGIALGDRHVVTCSRDRTVRVWSLSLGAPDAELPSEAKMADAHSAWVAHSLGVAGCAIVDGGARLLTWSHDRTARVWDLRDPPAGMATRAPLVELAGHDGAVLHAFAVERPRRIVTCSADRTLGVWDADGGGLLARLVGHTGAVRFAIPAPGASDRKLGIVSASDDRTVARWDAAGGVDRWTSAASPTAITACVPSPDGAVIAVSAREVRAADPRRGETWRVESVGATRRSNAVLAPGNGDVVVWSRDTVIHRLATDTGRVVALATQPPDSVACAAAPYASPALVGAHDGSLRIIRLDRSAIHHDGRWPTLSGGHGGPVSAIAFTPDGARAVSASWDTTLAVWELRTRARLHTLTGHTDRVLALALSRDGSRVVSASADRTLRLWDLESPTASVALRGHTDDVTHCAFTREQERVVSASRDGSLRVWSAGRSGGAIAECLGHTDWITGFALDEARDVVYSASLDRTVRAWDLATGEQRGVVYGHAAFHSVCVTTDGAIYAGDETGTLWRMEYGDGLRAAPRYVVATRAVNVRSENGLGAGVVATAPKGTRLEEIDVRGDWVRVRLARPAGDVVGYVDARHVVAEHEVESARPAPPDPEPPAPRRPRRK